MEYSPNFHLFLCTFMAILLTQMAEADGETAGKISKLVWNLGTNVWTNLDQWRWRRQKGPDTQQVLVLSKSCELHDSEALSECERKYKMNANNMHSKSNETAKYEFENCLATCFAQIFVTKTGERFWSRKMETIWPEMVPVLVLLTIFGAALLNDAFWPRKAQRLL